MALRLYNTASRSIEDFTPPPPGPVTMYACGPTVYDKTHIGHMRKYIGDDILRRTLTLFGYDVRHVMNITDVGHLTDDSDQGEDKLEGKAEKEGRSVWDIAKYYTDYFHDTMRAINILKPDIEPKATDHVPDMIAMVEKLVEKGFAYQTAQAVYFDVSKDTDYGKLSGQKISDKLTAVRDEVITDPEKKNPADFALWFKRTGRFADHTMYWPSPWGDGFPGWHIECSAMSIKYLGETIDIHTGGIDHIPVHHENEIAQSECSTGHPFVRFWVHHDFLNVDGEKMSKSKNNFYTIEDIRARGIDSLAVRLLFMQTSYRKPLNFTWDALESANKDLKKIRNYISKVKHIALGTLENKYDPKQGLEDDLNTAKFLALFWGAFNDGSLSDENKLATIYEFDKVLGLDLASTPEFVISSEAKEIMVRRDTARTNKDFDTSDKLRRELEALGYEVLDTPEGTKLN